MLVNINNSNMLSLLWVYCDVKIFFKYIELSSDHFLSQWGHGIPPFRVKITARCFTWSTQKETTERISRRERLKWPDPASYREAAESSITEIKCCVFLPISKPFITTIDMQISYFPYDWFNVLYGSHISPKHFKKIQVQNSYNSYIRLLLCKKCHLDMCPQH